MFDYVIIRIDIYIDIIKTNNLLLKKLSIC